MPRAKHKPLTTNGRPQILIDWVKVDKWLQGHMTGEAIAGLLGMHPNTFYDRVQMEKGVGFSEYSRSKRTEGCSLVQYRQFTSAMSGNSTMLKLLGEEWLKQGRKDDNSPNDEKIDALIAHLNSLKQSSDAPKSETNPELPTSNETL